MVVFCSHLVITVIRGCVCTLGGRTNQVVACPAGGPGSIPAMSISGRKELDQDTLNGVILRFDVVNKTIQISRFTLYCTYR